MVTGVAFSMLLVLLALLTIISVIMMTLIQKTINPIWDQSMAQYNSTYVSKTENVANQVNIFEEFVRDELTKDKEVLQALLYGSDILDPYPLDWSETEIYTWGDIQEPYEKLGEEDVTFDKMVYYAGEAPLTAEKEQFAKQITMLQTLWEGRRDAHVGIRNKINPIRVGVYKWRGEGDDCMIWLQFPGTDL
jgi:hypothetical protein